MSDIDGLFAQLDSKSTVKTTNNGASQKKEQSKKTQQPQQKPDLTMKNPNNQPQQQQKQIKQQQQQPQKAEQVVSLIEQPTLFKLDRPSIYGRLDAKDYATLQNGSEIIKEIVSDGFKFRNKIDNKAFLIEKFKHQLRNNTKYSPKELESVIGKKALKQVSTFGIPKKQLKFTTFLPMNNLWKTYIRQIIPNDLTDENGFAKFLKSDLHGSIIQVLKSKVETYEGMEGIVLQEKLKTFRIITREDKIITVIKQNSVFLFEIYPTRVFKVYGCHLQIRPSDRIKQRFKMRAASQFVLNNS